MSAPATAADARPDPHGVASGEPDLWCTYAALRTLSWLGRAPSPDGVASTERYLLGRRNSDGGYAWSAGMPSDAWATFYCTQALRDLGRQVPDTAKVAEWLTATWSGDAYAMTPGQTPDVWATHFSTRTVVHVCGTDVPDRHRLLDWLGSLQTATGGLAWSPGSAAADVRACYYGVAAWQALDSVAPAAPPWDVAALVRWLRRQQTPDGGFCFSPKAHTPCMWATYRATAALHALGHTPERSAEQWIRARRGPSGAFVRWEGYEVEDVWASFCAVGALQATGAGTADVADRVAARMSELACAEGGYTYREPAEAADVLTTAATVLARPADDALPARTAWLEGCQLPNEGGLMYMPGRGSEIRCTLWALTAGAFGRSTDAAARDRIGRWLGEMQNTDGGFGFWEGRGSELLSTSAAVAVADRLGLPLADAVDIAALARFTAERESSWARSGESPALRPALQAARIRHALGDTDPTPVTGVLDEHRVRGGGWANVGHRMPDLLTTYEAVTTADLFGVSVEPEHLRRFVDRVDGPEGTAWSPLAPSSGGALADCLGALLRRRIEQPGSLPPLVLS